MPCYKDRLRKHVEASLGATFSSGRLADMCEGCGLRIHCFPPLMRSKLVIARDASVICNHGPHLRGIAGCTTFHFSDLV